MSTRRNFLKRQLLLSSSLLLASNVNSFAKVAKIINASSKENTLNLLCSSSVEHLNKCRQTINNFEMNSINLFAGSISNTKHFSDLTYDLSKANYHAINFSWQNSKLKSEEVAKILKASSSNFVNCNYTFKYKELENLISPFIIIFSGSTKIGITGIGANTDHQEIRYEDPIAALNKIAKRLKTEDKCDKVVCLADLGFSKNLELNNLLLAQASAYVDIVVGAGENFKRATVWSYRNAEKQEVLISANKTDEYYTNLLQFNTINNQILNFNTKNI